MREHGETEKANGQAERRGGDEQGGGNQRGANGQGYLACAVEGEATANQLGSEKTAAQAAQSREGIWHPGEVADRFNVEAARVGEIFRQPENKEEPGGVSHELRGHEPQHFAMAKQA